MRRVRIPADVDKADRILGSLTARQVAVLAIGALVLWGGYWLIAPIVPLPALLLLALPVLAVTAALALGHRDGLSGDLFALAALRHLLQPARRAAAPDGLPPVPGPLATLAPALAPLGLPVQGLNSAGILDLGNVGSALLVRASSVNFVLRAQAEQDALVAAFGRFLNGTDTALQIVVHAERVDLRAVAADLERAAPTLANPAVETAAREHAAFLRSLSDRKDLLHYEVLLVLRDPAPPATAEAILRRRAEEAASLLRGAGVTLHALDGAQALVTLLRAADPEAPAPSTGTALPDQPVTGRS
jgi:hypothetical protein